MLDMKFIRENPDAVKAGAALKNADVDVEALLALDAERRTAVTRSEELKAERNELSMEIGRKLKAKEDADSLKARVRDIGDESKALDDVTNAADAQIRDRLLRIPNLPDATVPAGRDESENKVIREWGAKPEFAFTPKGHWEIGEKLGILDFARGAKISGGGFPVYMGAGARLERILINFFLDRHTEQHGYKEVLPPFLVSQESMTGTGQYPKFVETDGAYKIEGEDAYLIPTAEVPVTNLHRDEILSAEQLPISYAAYTPCFRREAGSYGKETRGITRIHQFDKVELVHFTKPEVSMDVLQTLLGHAEAMLQALGLHYRVVEICTGDLGFSNVKQFDLEVWAPGMDRYLEVSSCANFTDYQARRANIRFRREARAKPEFVHTLNGSGLALPRTVVAVLESGQREDGTVRLPEALHGAFGREIL